MKRTFVFLVAGVLAVVGAGVALAETSGEHKVFLPQDIEWGPAPAALPSGAESATLFGDPTKEGLFALRFKVPKGYRIAPHTHPSPELVTVVSGRFGMGLGDAADRGKVQWLPAGSFSIMYPGVAHYVFVDEDTVVQINAMGPWGIDYLDPKDDPRKQIAK